jgi:electron transfer flavoprotein alpha subunit
MAVEILKDKCIGCGACFKACPYDDFEFEAY